MCRSTWEEEGALSVIFNRLSSSRRRRKLFESSIRQGRETTCTSCRKLQIGGAGHVLQMTALLVTTQIGLPALLASLQLYLSCIQNRFSLEVWFLPNPRRELFFFRSFFFFSCDNKPVKIGIQLILLFLQVGVRNKKCVSSHLISSHLSLDHEGQWGTTDDFATSLLFFPCCPLPSGTWRTPGLSIP